MIVDTSALIAVFFQEPGFETFLGKLEASSTSGIGAPTLVETGVVLSSRLGRDARPILVELLAEHHVVEVPFGEPHWREALRAYMRYGRGRHRAGLNYGDCMAYAVARVAREPLLFAGDDFAATDIAVA